MKNSAGERNSRPKSQHTLSMETLRNFKKAHFFLSSFSLSSGDSRSSLSPCCSSTKDRTCRAPVDFVDCTPMLPPFIKASTVSLGAARRFVVGFLFWPSFETRCRTPRPYLATARETWIEGTASQKDNRAISRPENNGRPYRVRKFPATGRCTRQSTSCRVFLSEKVRCFRQS